MIKGIVKLEFVDVNSGEVTKTVEKENFIFNDMYTSLWTNDVPRRPVIIGRGNDIFPAYDKYSTYYSSLQWLSGSAPASTTLRTFYPKTEDSPAYYDFYSLFQPPVTRSIIPCVGISNSTRDNAILPSGAEYIFTALNLDPPCWQEPTEFLNIYYRLVMVDDDGSIFPDFIKNQLLLDVSRAGTRAIWMEPDLNTYPFRLNQDLSKDGFVNFLSESGAQLTNKTTTTNLSGHSRLRNVSKTFTFPDASPNQYTQANYALVNSLTRGMYNDNRIDHLGEINSGGTYIVINPVKVIPNISSSFTGIGNVFSSASTSLITIFDPANFPVGSGRMQNGGMLVNTEKNALATTYKVEISEPGQTMVDAEYKFTEYQFIGRHDVENTGYSLPLFPTCQGKSNISLIDYLLHKNVQYKEPNKVHISEKMRTYISGRSFLTWDQTGITIYDVYEGKIESFDISSPASLNVTNVVDVKVDVNKNIWIACTQTGLWKLYIDDLGVTLTHIGVLPASQQKCYAIDVDSTGTIYAVFWGTGLFYSLDSGNSWINAIINYSPFSDFENGGLDSKWRYVRRLICNPTRNSVNGDFQLLLINDTLSPDYTTSAGCWYDQQTGSVVGITNSTIKGDLLWARDYNTRENVSVSESGKWFFAYGGSSVRWMNFNQNTAMTSISFNTGYNNTGNLNACYINKKIDPSTGTLKEFLILSNCNGSNYTGTSGGVNHNVIDIETMVMITWNNAWSGVSQLTSTFVNLSNVIEFSENILITFTLGQGQNCGFRIKHRFPYQNKSYHWLFAKKYGWDGANWVLNEFAGGRPLHSTMQPLGRGSTIKFTDGNPATTSWAPGDTSTFTVFDGFFKDNSSTMVLRDSHYWKPTDVVTKFEPSVVTLIDKSSDIGFVNQNPIELDWNIDDLPDTRYSGGIITNGDPYFGNIVFLDSYDVQDSVPIVGTNYTSKTGTPMVSTSNKIFGVNTNYFDGESGYFLNTNTSLSPTTKFTLEFIFNTELANTKQYLADFRTNETSMGAFLISETSRIALEVNGLYYGNIGTFILPGVDYHVVIQRETNNEYNCWINGVKEFTFTHATVFPSTVPLHLFKRYAKAAGNPSWQGFKGWIGGARLTTSIHRYSGASFTPITERFLKFGNNYSGAGLVLSGNYNTGSLVSTRELVGDWEVIFHSITPNMLADRRFRPKLAFGVSVVKFIETPTDISYRICGNKSESFLNTHSAGTTVSTSITNYRVKKVGTNVKGYTSINNGQVWTEIFSLTDDNPLHFICMWQVQRDIAEVTTPSVEIVSNGSAVFSKIGDPATANGFFNPKFLAVDVGLSTDVEMKLDGVTVTNMRTTFVNHNPPLQGEACASQNGTVTFHPGDIGKAITGKAMSIHD